MVLQGWHPVCLPSKSQPIYTKSFHDATQTCISNQLQSSKTPLEQEDQPCFRHRPHAFMWQLRFYKDVQRWRRIWAVRVVCISLWLCMLFHQAMLRTYQCNVKQFTSQCVLWQNKNQEWNIFCAFQRNNHFPHQQGVVIYVQCKVPMGNRQSWT